jgi:hypothetical protein
MQHALTYLAAGLAVAAIVLWAALGANRGWTKTSVPQTTVDEVTGIEAITYESRFVPGVDFLGAGLLGAGVLAGVACFFRRKPAATANDRTPQPK